MRSFNLLWLLIIAIVLSQTKVRAETLYCVFKDANIGYETETSTYYCYAEKSAIFVGKRITIDGVSGVHLASKRNHDVVGVYINQATNMDLFPRGLNKIFANIHMINVYYSQLNEITQDDMKAFPNLKYLWIYYNYIKFLREDTFDENPRLEALILNNNQLQHIDPGTFSRLSSLRVLHLAGNTCSTLTSVSTAGDVENLIIRIKNGECKNDVYTTTTTTENPLIKVMSEKEKENEALQREVATLIEDNKNLTRMLTGYSDLSFSMQGKIKLIDVLQRIMIKSDGLKAGQNVVIEKIDKLAEIGKTHAIILEKFKGTSPSGVNDTLLKEMKKELARMEEEIDAVKKDRDEVKKSYEELATMFEVVAP
jgi:hypothetical protein